MQTKVKYMIDEAFVLQPASAVAITATALSGAKPIARESGLKGHPDAVAEGHFAVVVIVDTIDTSTDETYVIDVTVADDVALGTNAAVVASRTVTEAGLYTMIIDSEEVDRVAERANAGAKPAFIGVNAVLGGTTPSLDYQAFISPTAND